jgi:hypothetical protein
MSLAEYFESTEGTGVLATADSDGRVDVAVYARPHVIDDDALAFVMRERLTHRNLKSNPRAAYLFVEKGPGYKGKRLYLTKTREETNVELVKQLRRRDPCVYADQDDSNKYVVFFRIDRVRPLIGDEPRE